MPWVDMHDMLKHAYRNHYAVGGFSAISVDFIEGILTAAERCRSPVILNLSEPFVGRGDFELTVAAAERAAQRATVPVALHFESARSPESAVRAINLGCNGLTASATSESFPASVAHARRLTDIAHACGVTVEGDLARCEHEVAGRVSGEASCTTVDEAKAFVQRTRVDCLAVSVGNMQSRARGRLKFDIERLRRINEAVRVPLVIHASTGPNDEQCHKLIQHGVARVNFSSTIEDAAGNYWRASARGTGATRYTELRHGLHDTVAGEVERCMHRCGSAGRAAEVLVQCRAWRPVEHVIAYNIEGADDAEAEAVMKHGREVLARIPGVRRVFAGWAVQEQPQFRCCWLVEFVHEKVIDSYREHPDHVAFATRLFRPIAGDRISIDFVEAGRQAAALVSGDAERIRA